MRTAFCVATVLIMAAGTAAFAAEHGAMKIAQATDPAAPAATPGAPAPTPAPGGAVPTPAPGAAAPTPAPGAAAPTPGAGAAPAPAPGAPTAAAPAAAAAPKLVGVAAWSQLIGNSITGKENGKTLTEYYAPDGTTKSMTGNEISTGTW